MKKRSPSGMSVVVDIPDFSEIHLAKDVGEIPRTYSRLYGETSRIFYFSPSSSSRSLLSNNSLLELAPVNPLPLTIRNLPSTFIANSLQAIKLIISAIRHIRKSRVLLIFHLQPHWGFALSVVKPFLPKKLRIHLKMDLSKRWLLELRDQSLSSPWYIRYFHKQLIHLADIISVETRDMLAELQQAPLYGISIEKKLILMPNGISNLPPIDGADFVRKRHIVTVGRLGTYQKNTELFLNALRQVNLNDWKAILIGDIDSAFQNWLDRFMLENPQLASQVIFTGHISDRSKLAAHIKSASLFCLPSRWEGSALALLEALHLGCPILASDVGAAPDFIRDADVGRLFENDNVTSLAQNLQDCIDGKWDIEGMSIRAHELISERYHWNIIIDSVRDRWFNRSHP